MSHVNDVSYRGGKGENNQTWITTARKFNVTQGFLS